MFSFQIGSTYTFNTRARSVLGDVIENHTVKGIVDYATACKYANIDLIHRTIYPLLPAGTPDNPKNYTYLLLKSESSIDNIVVAYPWIDESTIQLVESVNIHVTVPTTDQSDAVRIRDMLTSMGYIGFTVEVKAG